jgi:hypothetical protein
MESYRVHLDRRVEERRAAVRAAQAESGCYVLTEEEFLREVQCVREP